MGRFSLSLRDYSSELSNSRLDIGPVNAVSLPGILTQVSDWEAAVGTVTLGVQAREKLYVFDNPLSGLSPTDKQAQREKKWAITFIDDTQFLDPPVNSIANPGYQKTFTVTIPTADLAQLTTPGTDQVDLTAGVWPNFVTKFQAIARSPYGGQPVITKITFVGRNL